LEGMVVAEGRGGHHGYSHAIRKGVTQYEFGIGRRSLVVRGRGGGVRGGKGGATMLRLGGLIAFVAIDFVRRLALGLRFGFVEFEGRLVLVLGS